MQLMRDRHAAEMSRLRRQMDRPASPSHGHTLQASSVWDVASSLPSALLRSTAGQPDDILQSSQASWQPFDRAHALPAGGLVAAVGGGQTVAPSAVLDLRGIGMLPALDTVGDGSKTGFISPLIGARNWTSRNLFAKTNPSPVATVLPQRQQTEPTSMASPQREERAPKRRKRRSFLNASKKLAANKKAVCEERGAAGETADIPVSDGPGSTANRGNQPAPAYLSAERRCPTQQKYQTRASETRFVMSNY